MGRATYYRYFKSKDALILFKFEQLTATWFASLKNLKNPVSMSFDDYFTLFIFFFYNNRKIISLLYNSGLKNLFMDFILELFLRTPSDNPHDQYKQVGVTYYFYGILEKWIQRDYKESAEELAKIMLDIVRYELPKDYRIGIMV